MESIQLLCVTDSYDELMRIAGEQETPLKYVLLRLGEPEGTNEAVPAAKQKKDAALLLKKLGIPTHIRGYRFLAEAVQIGMEDLSAVESITKCIYPEVAKRCATTSSRVERAIRHAIEVAWTKRGEIPFQQEVFGYTLDSDKAKPTNSQFVATLVDYMLH